MSLVKNITSTQWSFDINNPFELVQGFDAIKQAVFLILTTQKGTDPLRPDFGCGAFEYLDKPVNFAIPRMIKSITESLLKYEPRIENIKVTQVLNVSQSRFTISYTIKNTKTTDQLNVTYGNTTNT